MSSKFITLELAKEFAKDCRNLDMPYAEKDQLRRASMSIALNLVTLAPKSGGLETSQLSA